MTGFIQKYLEINERWKHLLRSRISNNVNRWLERKLRSFFYEFDLSFMTSENHYDLACLSDTIYLTLGSKFKTVPKWRLDLRLQMTAEMLDSVQGLFGEELWEFADGMQNRYKEAMSDDTERGCFMWKRS